MHEKWKGADKKNNQNLSIFSFEDLVPISLNVLPTTSYLYSGNIYTSVPSKSKITALYNMISTKYKDNKILILENKLSNMKYSILAEIYEKLEKESGKIKKTEILSELIKKMPTELLPKVILLVSGKIFPSYSEEKTGVAGQMMIKAISKSTGLSESEINNKLKDLGDLGLVAENCIKHKKQRTLSQKSLTIENVYDNIQKLSQLTGSGSQERKLNLIAELLSSAKPKEARYIVRSVLETLRIGVAEGIIRDSIAKAFNVNNKVVENAWFLNANYGEIAQIAKKQGESGLKKVRIELGKPIMVMLGEKSPTLEKALGTYENPLLEFKYDGLRIQIHKKDDKIWLFTRRLEDVTKQFPDLAKYAKKAIKAKSCLIEGETIGIDTKTKKPVLFQQLSRRIQRKYDIEKMVEKIPVQINLFDIIYLNGKSLFDERFENRRKLLEKNVIPISGKFELAKQIKTKNLKKAKEFYEKSLKANQEGLMIKNGDAKYQPGRRVGQWTKVKPTMENLDVTITSAEWGKGKRKGWFGSFTLSIRSDSEFLSIGKLGTGLKDEEFKKLTDKLKKLIPTPFVKTKSGKIIYPNKIEFSPKIVKIVIEVAYEQIQKSPKYESGFALRFPRLKRFRYDKSIEDVDTLDRIKKLYEQQFMK